MADRPPCPDTGLSPLNIYIIGAQSTGKTTLVSALSTHFEKPEKAAIIADEPTHPPRVLKEVARGVLLRHNLSANDITSSSSSALRVQQLILEAQAAAEEALRPQWYISDRSALDALVYAQKHAGKDGLESLIRGNAWQKAEKWMKDGLVVVCEAGGEWLVDDGVRLMPDNMDAWYDMHRRFCALLKFMAIPFTILPSSMAELEKRVDFVVREWRLREGRAHR